jgi:hypothetical protein
MFNMDSPPPIDNQIVYTDRGSICMLLGHQFIIEYSKLQASEFFLGSFMEGSLS